MLFFSCMKKASTCAYEDQNVAATTAEIAYLQNYITTSSITNVTQHPCGVFYTVENAGSGETLNLCNTITVKYGAFVLGAASPFDSFTDSSGIPFILGRLITGIQKTLPTIPCLWKCSAARSERINHFAFQFLFEIRNDYSFSSVIKVLFR